MDQLIRLFPMILLVPLIIFWFWMFSDMTNNDRLPSSSAEPLTWPPSTKYGWTLAFIFMNVFAACFYYFIEYKNRY